MVGETDAHRRERVAHLQGHLPVGRGGEGDAARMVVREQDARRAAEQRVLHDLAQRDGGHVHPALGETPAAEDSAAADSTAVTETPAASEAETEATETPAAEESETTVAAEDETAETDTEAETTATPEAEK